MKRRVFKIIKTFGFSLLVIAPNAFAQDAFVQSTFNQAKAYHDGDGVAVDLVRARVLYEGAARNGSVKAQINLGYMYFTGQGVPKDYAIARSWYVKAANTGDKVARANLNMMDRLKLGVSTPPPKPAARPDVSAPVEAVLEPSNVPNLDSLKQNAPILAQDPIQRPAQVLIQAPAQLSGHSLSYERTAPDLAPVKTEGLEALNVTRNSQLYAQNMVPAAPHEVRFGKSIALEIDDLNMARQAMIIMPQQTGIAIVLSLFSLGISAVIWFLLTYRNILLISQQRDFARDFFERNRAFLRVSYIRFPAEKKSIRSFDDAWGHTLCVLLVRHAQKYMRGEISHVQPKMLKFAQDILEDLARSSFGARKKLRPLMKDIQNMVHSDAYAVESEAQVKSLAGFTFRQQRG